MHIKSKIWFSILIPVKGINHTNVYNSTIVIWISYLFIFQNCWNPENYSIQKAIYYECIEHTTYNITHTWVYLYLLSEGILKSIHGYVIMDVLILFTFMQKNPTSSVYRPYFTKHDTIWWNIWHIHVCITV